MKISKLKLKHLLAVLIILLVSTFGKAADILNISSSLNRGQTILNDAGNLTITGRCFQSVAADLPYFAPLYLKNSSDQNVIAFVDGHVFLKSTLHQNQGSLSGDLVFANSVFQKVASTGSDGRMYLKLTLVTGSSCTAPPYEPSLWNSDLNVNDYNNCYNYGNNQITYTFAQPGRASGIAVWDPIVNDVRNAALSDGLTWVGAT